MAPISCPVAAGIGSWPPAAQNWIKWVWKMDEWMGEWINQTDVSEHIFTAKVFHLFEAGKVEVQDLISF